MTKLRSDHALIKPAAIFRSYFAWIAVFFVAAIGTAWGETAYITDQGEYHLRSGESTRYKITRKLTSGTPVEVLNNNRKSGYSHVALEDGAQGYILSRYLQEQPAARNQLADALSRLEELQQEPDQLASQLTKIREEHAALNTEYERVSARNHEIEQALAEVEHTAANIVQINEERNQLQQDVAKLTRAVGELEQENLALRSGDDRRWFLVGAGVAGGGLLLGLLLPSLGPKRRRGSSRDFF